MFLSENLRAKYTYTQVPTEIEHGYILAAKGGDKEAFERLWGGVFPLAMKIARRHFGHGAHVDDLMVAARYGLLKAIKHFDPEMGFHFITYAGKIMKNEQCGACALHRGVSKHTHSTIRKIAMAEHELKKQFGREPTDGEIAEYVGVSAGTITRTRERSKASSFNSLNDEVPGIEGAERQDNLTYCDVDQDHLEHDEAYEREELRGKIKLIVGELVGTLNAREAEVIERRFGLNGYSRAHLPDESLQNISLTFGVTRERTRQIEERAIEKMAQRLRDKARGVLGANAEAILREHIVDI